MAAHTFNASTWAAEAVGSEFESRSYTEKLCHKKTNPIYYGFPSTPSFSPPPIPSNLLPLFYS